MGRTILLVIAICAASILAAPGQAVVEEIFEQNYPIDATAKFTLQNADGSVRIYGADTKVMQLQAIKKAYSQERLRKISVDVAVAPGSVAIKTGYPPKPKWGLRDRSGTVDYIIILPWFCDVNNVDLGNGEVLIDGMRGNEVHARLGNGRLFGHNCFTDLHLDIGNGGLDVAYEWWENHPIELDTKIAGGSTRVSIPGDAEFRLKAETVDGHIFSDFTASHDRPAAGQTKLNLEVGSAPTAEMTVRAVNGSIIIKELYQ